MEMHQIRYFLAVCETLNFTRAAQNCHVAQPSLTRAIKGLENELGGPMFHRERNNMHLTELGCLMRPYLAEVFAQTAAAKAQAEKFAHIQDVALKIGVMCTIGPAVVSEFLLAYSQRHPGVELQVVEDTGRALGDSLKRGDVEVALYALPEDLSEEYHALPLFQEPFVIVVNDRHRFANVSAVSWSELDGERYVSRTNCEFFDRAGEVLEQHGARLNRVFSSERDDWVMGMIVAGLGLGFFPALSVTAPDARALPLIDPQIVRTVNLVTVRGRPHSPAVGALVREARRHTWTLKDPPNAHLPSA